MTLAAKLGLAFTALAIVAALPGLVLLAGVSQLRRQTRRSLVDLAERDACVHARASAVAALAALQSHAIFPRDSRFQEASKKGVAAAKEALRAAALGLEASEAAALRAETLGLTRAADPVTDSQGMVAPGARAAAREATLALTGHLDRLIAGANESLARRGEVVATTVDRLAVVGELGLVVTAALALGLAFALGRAWGRRMAILRDGVERVASGDLRVRIDDRETDEVGTLARNFNRMVGELQILEEMKSQFVAVASHELRTPLTLIDGYCGILLNPTKEPLSEWQRERIELIHSQVVELLSLLEDLLDAERLQARALEPVLEPLEPEALAAEIVRSFEAPARARGLTLRLSVAPGTRRSALADVRALTRVLRNLVDNALKYTEMGEVEVSLASVGPALLLRVRDTGCGISPADLPRIFGRFYQVNDGRPRRGFGLGLSIVRGLVERNGGRITAESELGRGSAFEVIWPLGLTPAGRQEVG